MLWLTHLHFSFYFMSKYLNCVHARFNDQIYHFFRKYNVLKNLVLLGHGAEHVRFVQIKCFPSNLLSKVQV